MPEHEPDHQQLLTNLSAEAARISLESLEKYGATHVVTVVMCVDPFGIVNTYFGVVGRDPDYQSTINHAAKTLNQYTTPDPTAN